MIRLNLKKIETAFAGCLFLLIFCIISQNALGQSNEDCLGCHEDPELTSETGRHMGVNAVGFGNSVHADFSCTDCHDQPADFDDIPHFQVYRKVKCATCHDDATDSYMGSFHGQALAKGKSEAPNCCACHCTGDDKHQIQPLSPRLSERACSQCHQKEAAAYDGSVHAAAASQGKASPGCTSCHPTHSGNLPPSTGAVNSLCVQCHQGSMQSMHKGGHVGDENIEGVMSCASCHDVHATHKPHLDEGTIEACQNCHTGYNEKFKGSVHENLLASDQMNCLSCHRTHQITDASESEDFGCGRCHEEEEQEYRHSAHRLARLHGDMIAATCADCHNGHNVLHAANPEAPVNHRQIPNTCGKCHTDEAVITSDYVRLPISLPSYVKSIHGIGWKNDKLTAVCTDCHGSHLLQSGSISTSSIHKQNLSVTCGKCHRQESLEYSNSVHGRAVAHGITDSPSCTDCHDEHLIFGVKDPRSSVTPANQATETCAQCHEDPEMAARYGLPAGVIESYKDSYHGWAIKRGGKAVAICNDCHNTHNIRSIMDPQSSIHKDNVVHTCSKCHPNSNAKFAASYSHILAQGKMMIHDWVKYIYIIMIIVVLGGMGLHNLIIYIHELRAHYKKVRAKRAIRRMSTSELVQHMILLISFTALAISGFALRFPDAWWVQVLSDLGLTEESRRIFHRLMAIVLVAASVYHVIFLIFTRRGRLLLFAILPKMVDITDAFKNMTYYLGLSKKRHGFGMFDYTQKAEYWALIWGTVLMSITGFVLWFPDIATIWLPAWMVRVCEVIHFYEAILAVAAIIIWHFFFVILLPREYPMSWIWINGRMPMDEWEHHHSREVEETGVEPEILEGEHHKK